MTNNGATPAPDSTSDLVSRAAAQMSTLVRDELALARTEMTTKARRAGLGAGLFGGAGVLVAYGIGLVLALAVIGLDAVWPLWAAILTVAVVVFAIAGTSALLGRSRLRQAAPPVPTEAVEGVSEDLHTIRTAVQERHSS